MFGVPSLSHCLWCIVVVFLFAMGLLVMMLVVLLDLLVVLVLPVVLVPLAVLPVLVLILLAQLSNEKKPGSLLYIGDYTTQLYGDF